MLTLHFLWQALMPACLAAFPHEPHLCFMSPHVVEFVQTSFFMFNSRFDAWYALILYPPSTR